MGGAGFAIIFVAAFVGCAIWSTIYLTFAAHYFLVTIIDSSSGNDEVHFPSEAIIEWWWKPFFCLWVLGFFVISSLIVLLPVLMVEPRVYLIAVALLVWLLFPLGLMSALFTSNWCFFLHPVLIWRMLKHYGAFAYVNVITLMSAALCGGLLYATFVHGFIWALPAAFMVPTVILFYARHWGRFAWLSINFAPRKSKLFSEYVDTTRDPKQARDRIPQIAVEEVDETAEGIREGLPPQQAIQTGMPRGLDGVV